MRRQAKVGRDAHHGGDHAGRSDFADRAAGCIGASNKNREYRELQIGANIGIEPRSAAVISEQPPAGSGPGGARCASRGATWHHIHRCDRAGHELVVTR
jgi:hypothetical protein